MDQPTGTLTTGQVAERLGVTPSTVKRWADGGHITVKFRTVGGHARFDSAVVDRFEAERSEAAAVPQPA